jgi:hypothetical protein
MAGSAAVNISQYCTQTVVEERWCHVTARVRKGVDPPPFVLAYYEFAALQK